MTSGTDLTKRYWRQTLLNIIVALVVGVLAIIFSSRFAGDITEADLRAKANETLSVQAETLTGLLDKYRLLSAVLANRDDVEKLLASSNDKDSLLASQKLTSRAAAASGALDVVLVKANGENIASGLNMVTGELDMSSSVMVAALQGRLGRGLQVLDGNNRAYVFASGIRLSERYVGAIAVYVGLEELEDNWSLSSMPIFATDERSMIVMSNHEKWRLKDFSLIKPNSSEGEFLDISRSLPLLNWQLHVLADVVPIKNAKLLWGGLAGFLVLLAAIGTQMLINRMHETSRRLRGDKATSLRLERIVRDRTHELVKSNASLALEVEERRQAEKQLRNTQNELIQTGKLAALGQMSTALSHEYNQPLSATKSYADNAIKYLKLQRYSEAADNITRISGLADRMADISKHLRNFARKPNTSFASVAITPIIEDALEVLSARVKSDGAIIDLNIEKGEIFVRAGHVRLQQVIVNLVLNALDVMSEMSEPRLSIELLQTSKQVMIKITDNGSGIKSENLNRIFDPFFTTKEVGKGLGLGLSISYNIIKDFGGELSAKNNQKGGAEFTILLEKGKKPKQVKGREA